MAERKKKLMSIAEAVGMIRDGDTVAIGGHTMRRHPMAAVREIIRQGKRDLKVIGWNNGIDVDLLIGAGCVKTVQTSYVGMSNFGLALRFRAAAEAGNIEVWEESETSALERFRAGAMGIGFIPSKAPIETAISENQDAKEIFDPFTDERYYALQAFNPDVAIVHAHVGDCYGNILLDSTSLGDNYADGYIAKSGNVAIVTVEEIADTEWIRANRFQILIPSFFVTAVVHVPYGAHPCSCDLRYDYDLDHMAEYHEASRTQDGFDSYLRKYVLGCRTHDEYLDAVGLAWKRRNEGCP
jgi:glutaconate CoA-transferase subunit A